MDIAEFLTARLDEDERVAQAAYDEIAASDRRFTPEELAALERDGDLDITADDTRPLVDVNGLEAWWQLAGITMRPSRVLAEVAAKRAIVFEHGDTHCCSGKSYPDQVWPDIDAEPELPCPTLRLLAQPYAEHPDCDPAWTVSSSCTSGGP